MDLLKKLFANGHPGNKCIMDAIIERGPVRGDVRENSWGCRGPFTTYKGGQRGIYWEFELELAFIRWLEVSVDVRRFTSQPFALELTIDSEMHIHTPDLLIELIDGSLVVWEVKSTWIYQKQDFGRIEPIARALLADYGIDYCVKSESDKPGKVEEENIGIMLRYQSTDPSSKLPLLKNWPDQNPHPIATVMAGLLGEPLAMNEVVAMIREGALLFDVDNIISKQLLVFPNQAE